jgi:glutaredoxin
MVSFHMMDKKSIVKAVLLLVGIVILIVGLWYWTKPDKATEITSSIIFFYGRECPHCQDVEKFIEENKITEKVQLDRLEVFHNTGNQTIYLEKAKECGINNSEIIVPFLFDAVENKCLTGTPDIEDFLSKKAQMK